MTAPDESTPLAEEELDRLETLLGSAVFHGESLPLDALQGFFFAIASAPDLIVPSRWMPVALGKPEFEDQEQAQDTLALVMRYYNGCVREVGTDDFGLILYGVGDERDFETWCTGYLEAVDLSHPDWYEAGDPDEVDELLFPFVVLADALPEKQRRELKPAEWRHLVKSCEDALGDSIVAIREYWKVVRTPSIPVRRESPKVGRNDPCPCGSGKKYKQCCGAQG